MKTMLFASAALALPIALGACSTAGLTETEKAMAEQNTGQSAAMQNEVSELNRLTRIYIDAAALYKQAADLPDEDNGLKPMLLDLAKERNEDRDMLQDRVLALGAKPAESGEALSTAHRSFTSLRTLVDNDSDVAVEEVLRGERYIRDEIDKVMQIAMTPQSKTLLAQLRTDTDAQITRLEGMDPAM